MMIIEESKKIIEKDNIGLIVIDSLVAHFRSEYPGRENLARDNRSLTTTLPSYLGLRIYTT